MGFLSVMIREFYQNRTVLLTGGTGFYGQGLTAKILRYLPEIRRLYLILRPGRSPDGAALPSEERLHGLFEQAAFERFRREEPQAFALAREKVRAIACDMRAPGLGLDDESRAELLREVDLIIGNAASVTFDEALDSAIQFNALAPQELLRLAREGAKKPVLVHVSTAYANGRQTGSIPERPLPIDRTVQQLIDGVEPANPFVPEEEIATSQAHCQSIREKAQSEEQQRQFRREIVEQSHSREISDSRLKKLVDDRCRRWTESELVKEGMRRARLCGWNDVYTFTKAMGEQLLVKHQGDVPLAIVRPSTTEGALADPHPGWIHGLKVTDPLVVAYGRGLVPDFPAAVGAPMDLVPVDIVVNTVLAAATQARGDRVEVFHAATSGENPLPNTRMFKYIKAYFEEFPLLNKDGSSPQLVDWTFPTVRQFQRVFNWKYLYPLELKQKLYQHLPERWATVQKKRRLAAIKARLKRVQYFTDLFSPYTTLDCRYETVRMLALYESLPAEEQRIFNMDVRQIDWHQYYQKTHLPGLRRHELGGGDGDAEPLRAAPGEEVGGEERRWQIEGDIRTIPDLLRAACIRHHGKTALQIERSDGWLRVSYGELLTAAEAMARNWQAEGLASGAKVLLCGDNSPEWVIAYMAASLLGLVVVPIDPQTREKDIWRLCEFVEARAFIVGAKRFSKLSPEGVVAHKELAFYDLDRAGMPFGDNVCTTTLQRDVNWHAPAIEPEDIASLIFTSVIEPRGVELRHGNFVANLLALAEVQNLYEQDRVLSTLPLHHALEFTGGLLVPLLGGATITYLEALNSREMLRTMRDTGTTVMLTVPRLLRVIADRIARLSKPGEGDPSLARLRLVVSGGAALSEELRHVFERMGVGVYQGYGLSEAAPVVAVNAPGQCKAQSVGRVLPGQEVRVLHPDKRGIGEILLRGANVTRGYFARPELSEKLLQDGWLHTGDLGYVDREGYLFIDGRSKDLIVTGAGKNIYPQEVESFYADLPQVAELGVVGVYSERTEGEEVHGVAVLVRGDQQETNVREQVVTSAYEIARLLPSYHRIHRLHIWTRPLPRSDDGSVDRQALLVEIEGDSRLANEPIEALPAWEQAFYRRIGQIAGLSPGEVAAHIDAPLDTLLDSLMAVEFTALLARRGIRLGGIDRSQDTLRKLLVQHESGLKGITVWEEDGRAPAYWARILRAQSEATTTNPSGKKIAQGALWGIGGPLFRRYFDIAVDGLEHLPQDRPYLIAANHASHLDGPSVYTAIRSQVDQLNVVAAQDYFVDAELRGWFLHALVNAVPLDRHGDFAESLVRAGRLLAIRRPLLVFPEGTRSINAQLQPFKSGVGLLAYEMGVPVVPLHIAGTQEALPRGSKKPARHPLRLLFGPPFESDSCKKSDDGLNSYEVYREIAESLKRRIEALGRKNI